MSTNYSVVNAGTGSTTLQVISGYGDSAVDGLALDMQTGANHGSVSGIQKVFAGGVVPVIGRSFSMMAMQWLNTGGDIFDSALCQELSNDFGEKMEWRSWNGQYQARCTKAGVDQWLSFGPYGGDFPTEAWLEAAYDTGSSTYTLELLLGTKSVHKEVGVTLPTGTPRKASFLQQSVGQNYRHSRLTGFSIGRTQKNLAANCCSKLNELQISPSQATFACLIEDASLQTAPQTHVNAYISRNNKDYWSQVTLSEIARWPKGGSIDNPCPEIVYAGVGNFAGPANNQCRWNVTFAEGNMVTMKGAAIVCE